MATILITGAEGNLGAKVRQALEGRFELRLIDRSPGADPGVYHADLSRWDGGNWRALFSGVDAVIHLAANPDPLATWESVTDSNIDATANVLLACAQTRVPRFVFASSSHVLGGYKDSPMPTRLDTDLPPRPGTRYVADGRVVDSTAYGYSKLIGEHLGRSFADATGLSVIVVRIGWVLTGDNHPASIPETCDPWFRLMWLSNRDLCQMMEKAVLADLSLRFAIVNAMSDNPGMRWDIEHTRTLLGYQPQDGVVQPKAFGLSP